MKVCAICGEEIGTRDGENRCTKCEDFPEPAPFTMGAVLLKKTRKRRRKSARDEAMESLGLVKVRGAFGGVYYE